MLIPAVPTHALPRVTYRNKQVDEKKDEAPTVAPAGIYDTPPTRTQQICIALSRTLRPPPSSLLQVHIYNTQTRTCACARACIHTCTHTICTHVHVHVHTHTHLAYAHIHTYKQRHAPRSQARLHHLWTCVYKKLLGRTRIGQN